MFKFRFVPGCEIAYQTADAIGADLIAREGTIIPSDNWRQIPTGVWIEKYTPPADGRMMELQVRPRSGLAYHFGVTVLNSPGTIDPDYRSEICVLLYNHSRIPYEVKAGDRIAQLVPCTVDRLDLPRGDLRMGGFGSTETHWGKAYEKEKHDVEGQGTAGEGEEDKSENGELD